MTAITLARPQDGLGNRWGIAPILTLGAVSLITLLMVLVTIADIQRERSIYHDSVANRGLVLTSGLNDILANYLHSTQIGSLREISAMVRTQPDVDYVNVFHPDGRLLVEGSPAGERTAYATGLVDDAALGVIRGREPSIRFEGDNLQVTSPIRAGANIMGAVQIGFDGASLRSEVRRTVVQHIWQGLILVALGVVLAYLIARRVAQPLKAVSGAARNIGRSDLEEPVLAMSAKETTVLGQSLERMRIELLEVYTGLDDKVAEISKINQDLEKQIADRKMAERDLARHAVALEAANREMEAFSYSVSHDLRAPLRSINGFSQVLLEDCAEQLDEIGKDYLNRIMASSQRMGELIGDLLQLSRISRGEINRDPMDLSSMAQQIKKELLEGAPERQVEFVIAPGLTAHGDAHLLNVVLENLLRNAWKFTRPHQQALIEFGMELHEGEPIFFVRDDGVGLDMSYADKLFAPFQRLHSLSEFDGTGIGLATVQRIIHKHGGRVWAEGALEKGASVYFTL